MVTPDGERLARIEQLLVDRERIFTDMERERDRTRQRLHKLEGLVAGLVDAQKLNRREEDTQYRRMEVRVQWLAVVVALAAVIEPFLYHLANGG